MTTANLAPALEAGIRRVDELADRTFGGWKVPGLVYGVTLGQELVHVRGLGTLRVGEDALPDGRSVFRIASMTKSFTAATVLSLRDAGGLRLDDPIEQHVPELANLRYPTTDSPRITVRHLLTMTAGFPTDDPWGDRQQGLDLGEFSRLLANGLSFAWTPGTRFEYSNTGYGILGRLITNVAGREYREVVRERMLAPLGMHESGYLEEEADSERLARGYLWRDGGFIEEPMDPYGALAPMGGLFTTVEDLARWVAGFVDAFPPRDDPDTAHPLSRASRREMQQPMVPEVVKLSHVSADAMPDVEGLHYGFGLFQLDDLRYGRTIGHSGGYPGFGTHMRWHPSSGLGVIAFANHRYAPAAPLARDMLNELVRSEAAPVRRTRANAATLEARETVERLLAGWDDALAARTFAMNVELDEPVALRKAAAARLVERHGALHRDADTPDESLTAYHLVWWLRGDRGRVRAEVLLSPELPPKVQALNLTSVSEPPEELRHAAARIAAALDAPPSGRIAVEWPAGVEVSEQLDHAAVVRAMRATEARFAPLTVGPVMDGDGARKATFRLTGPRGRVDLTLTLDSEGRRLEGVTLVPVKLAPPSLD